MHPFIQELSKVQCRVSHFAIADMQLFALHLPLGAIVIVEPTVKGRKRTPEQAVIKGAFESAGIRWLCFQSHLMARRAADGIVNRDRTRAEVLKLAKEYTAAATAYEDQDRNAIEVPCFDEQDEALRSMVHMMNKNEATTCQVDTDL